MAAAICAWMSLLSPQRKRRAWATSWPYSSSETRPTQGAEQRLIWNCRHGRVRLWNTGSEQERSRKAFCRVVMVRLTAPADANGPKYSPLRLLEPRCLETCG